LGLQALDAPLVEMTRRWSGPVPGCLHARLGQAPSGGWGRALACVALAAAIWTTGLNLYAARQADEGQRLKALMSQQVRQAFPEVPVVLNPCSKPANNWPRVRAARLPVPANASAACCNWRAVTCRSWWAASTA
jgi:hypothetical protein